MTGWAPTMMRETSWYHWVYPEPHFRKCPKCILNTNTNNINNIETENIEHLLKCKSNTDIIDLSFKNYFKEDEIFLNNLLNIESKKKRSHLATPIYIYDDITRILKLLGKNTKKINNIIKEIFSRKIIHTYINTWLPRCKALELLENDTKTDNKKRRKLMKTRPLCENPKLEDGIPKIKKTIRNIINLNEFNQRINTLVMYGRLASAELLNIF
jgi:hypothetical protein